MKQKMMKTFHNIQKKKLTDEGLNIKSNFEYYFKSHISN